MSSVDWKKLRIGTNQTIAMVRHASRYDNDESVNYRNKFIDKMKYTQNETITDGRGAGTSFYELFRLQSRMEKIDEALPPKRRKKDRIIAISFCVSKPEEVSREQEGEFFEICYRNICDICGGAENVTAGYIHRDEIHDYLDAETGERRTSLAHLHCVGIPYVQDVGINAKNFMTTENMTRLNEAIDKECQERLHVKFLVGLKSRSGRTVEDLQIASERRALQQRERQREIEENIEKLKAKEEQLKKEIEKLKRQKEEAEAEKKRVREEYTKLANLYNALVREFNELKEEAKRLKIQISEKIEEKLRKR